MRNDEVKALQTQLNDLQGDYKTLRREFMQYKKDNDAQLKKLEKALYTRIESIYRDLRKTQVIEKQKLVSAEQSIIALSNRINK